jgi:arabinose-5-phosphate isomerase
MLENHTDFLQLTAEKIMTKNPKSIEADTLAYNAYRTMEEFNITQLPVLNSGNYVGMVHLHDILKEGIF